jgi:hypothetical protein
MSVWERRIIAIGILLTTVWGLAIFTAYILFAPPPPPPSQLESPTLARGDEAVTPVVMSASSSGPLPFPTAAAVAISEPDAATRRKWIEAVSHAKGNQERMGGIQWGWSSRFSDQTGTILPASAHWLTDASTAPATQPAIPPTLITLHLSQVPLRKALEAFAQAAHCSIAISPPGWLDEPKNAPAITLNAESQPLMEVLNELCSKSATRCMVDRMGGYGGGASAADPATPVLRIEHQQGSGSLGKWVVNGPFAIELTQLSRSASLASGADPQASLQASFNLSHEPGFVVLSHSLVLEEAVDDAGLIMKAQSQNRPEASAPRGVTFLGLLAAAAGIAPSVSPAATSPEERWDNPMMFQGMMEPFQCPLKCGRTLARLRGTAKFLVVRSTQRVELPIDSPPADVSKTVGGISFSISNWQANQNWARFSLTLHRTQQTDKDWGRLTAGISTFPMVLLDSDGQPYPTPRFAGGNSGGGSDALCYFMSQQFYGGGESTRRPGKLLIDLPSSMAVVEVPFEFNNIPLP